MVCLCTFVPKQGQDILNPSQPALGVNAGRETGGLYSAVLTRPMGTSGGRRLGIREHQAGHAFAPSPYKAVVNHPLRPTPGHPDSWWAAHSAHTYLASDTARWPKWINLPQAGQGDGQVWTGRQASCTHTTHGQVGGLLVGNLGACGGTRLPRKQL
jgi:hypothetical protein